MMRSSLALCAVAISAAVLLSSASLGAGESMQSWRKRFDGAGLAVGINPLNPNTVVAERSGGELSISYDRGATWQPWSSTGLAFVRQIIIHPSDTMTVFCAASSPALLRSTDFGQTWQSVLVNFGIDGESISWDPVQPDTMFAGNFADGGVSRSIDRGATWQFMGSVGSMGSANLCALAIRPDSANILYAGSGGGRISKSTNYGATWRVVKNGTAPPTVFQETPRIVVHPLAPLVAYATSYGTVDSTLDVWKTVDGGEHWTRTALQRTPTWSLEFDPVDPNVVYAGTFYDEVAAVFRTSDGGDSWTPLEAGLPAGGYMWNMKIHPLDPSVVWIAVTHDAFGPEGLFRLLTTSTMLEGYLVDGGSGDTVDNGIVSLPLTGDKCVISPASKQFRFGYFEGDPSLAPSAHTEAYPYLVASTPLAFAADSLRRQDIVLQRLATRSIGGQVLDSVTLDPVPTVVRLLVHRLVGDTVLTDSTDAGGEFLFPGVYATESGVNSYDALQFEVPPPYATTSIAGVVLGADDLSYAVRLLTADVFLVAAADSGTYIEYYRSTLQALGLRINAWDVLRRGAAPLGKAREFGFKSVILYTGDLAAPLPGGMADSISSCLEGGGSIFLTGQNIAEYNAGTPLFSGTLGVGFAGNTSLVYCQGVSGDILQGYNCFTTAGDGADNQTSRDSLTILRSGVARILDYGSNTGRAAAVRVDSAGPAGAKAVVMGFGFEAILTTAKRQALMNSVLNYFRGVTGVVRSGDPSVPDAFSLEQNYPNPFNPATTIRFSVARAAHVTLSIYDLNGRKVAVLADGWMEPGAYALPWSASGVASGVYYYRLEVPGFHAETRKLLVVQ